MFSPWNYDTDYVPDFDDWTATCEGSFIIRRPISERTCDEMMSRLANIIAQYSLTSYGNKQYRLHDDTYIDSEVEIDGVTVPLIGGNFSFIATVAVNDDSCELEVGAYLDQFAEIDCDYLFTHNE